MGSSMGSTRRDIGWDTQGLSLLHIHRTADPHRYFSMRLLAFWAIYLWEVWQSTNAWQSSFRCKRWSFLTTLDLWPPRVYVQRKPWGRRTYYFSHHLSSLDAPSMLSKIGRQLFWWSWATSCWETTCSPPRESRLLRRITRGCSDDLSTSCTNLF